MAKRAFAICVLAGTLCAMFPSDACFAKKKTPKISNETVVVPQEELKRYPMRYEASHMRDPFLSYLKKEVVAKPQQKTAAPKELAPQPPVLQVQGIVTGGTVAQAIINDRVVSLGESFGDGIKLVEIRKDGITVMYKGSSYFFTATTLLTGDNGTYPKGEKR